MKCNRFLISFFLCSISNAAVAQFRIPSMDFSLKGGYINLPDNYKVSGQDYSYLYESLYIQGEVNLHIGQHFAIGYFQNRTAIISNYHSQNGNETDQDAKHLMQGINVRLSTGRSTKFRPYFQVKYILLETVVDYGSYRIATEATGTSIGGGLMLRLGNRLYLNLVEAEFGKLLKSNDVLFRDKGSFLLLKTGISYNIGKKK